MIEKINVLILLVTILTLQLLTGCAPKQPIVSEEQVIREGISRIPQDESLSAMELIDENTIPLPPSNLKSPDIGAESANEEGRVDSKSGIVEIPGFRVQIFVTNEEYDARQVEEEAMLKFDENVYLSFDSPNYKIRIGDCATRSEANDLRSVAARTGYRDAWVVQCKVLTKTQ